MRRGRTLRDRALHRNAGTRSPRVRLRLALFLVVLVLVVACAAGRVRPSVKLGLVAPFEGRYRYEGYDVIHAVRLALREANRAGGVAGYSVELIAFDDGGDTEMAAEQASKLTTDPALVGAIGHFREDTTAIASRVYSEEGTPFVAMSMVDPAVFRSTPTFRMGAAADSLATALLELVHQELGEREAGLVTSGGPLGRAVVRRAEEAGIRLVAIVSPEDEDWPADLYASKVGVVVCDLDPVPAGEAMVTLRAAGWDGKMLGGPGLLATDFRAIAGDYAVGVWCVTPWPFPDDIPGGERFADAYRTVSGSTAPGLLALAAYEATWVLLEAVEKDIAANGEPTAAGIAAALGMTDRRGLLGRIRFTDSGNWSDGPIYRYRVDPGGVLTLVRQQGAIQSNPTTEQRRSRGGRIAQSEGRRRSVVRMTQPGFIASVHGAQGRALLDAVTHALVDHQSGAVADWIPLFLSPTAEFRHGCSDFCCVPDQVSVSWCGNLVD